MKKLLITILLVSVVSCTPISISHPIPTPTATATAEATTATPMLPLATQTQTINSIVQRAYDPAEWIQLYDKDMVLKVILDPTRKMWIWLGEEIGFFNGNNWTLFSKQDYGLQDTPYDMAIGPDGAVWVSGREAISRYQKGHWVAFGIPNASETAFHD